MEKWALILGASSGIGAECAKRLAKNGINIYGLYLRKRKKDIDLLTDELKQYNVNVIYKKANASNEDTDSDGLHDRIEVIDGHQMTYNGVLYEYTTNEEIVDSFCFSVPFLSISLSVKSKPKIALKPSSITEVLLVSNRFV